MKFFAVDNWDLKESSGGKSSSHCGLGLGWVISAVKMQSLLNYYISLPWNLKKLVNKF